MPQREFGWSGVPVPIIGQGTWNIEDAYIEDREPCSCGAKTCRGLLTEEDWKRADVQRQYAGHFHPMIEAQGGAYVGSWGCDANADGLIDETDLSALTSLLQGRRRAVGHR